MFIGVAEVALSQPKTAYFIDLDHMDGLNRAIV
jgi:hypothetical protein